MLRQPEGSPGDRVPRSAWALLGLLTLLNVLNFVDRQLIASLAPLLIAELGLTRAQIGLLVGFAFVVLYSLVGLALGAAADRVSRPRLIAVGLALWSAMTAVSGMARSFAQLAVPRVLVGIGEATLTPAALSMLADVVPPRRLGLATGIYYAGIPVGLALSLIIAAAIAPRHGWRACFYLLGLVGLGLSLVLPFVKEPRPPQHAARSTADAHGPRTGALGLVDIARTVWQTLRRTPALALTIAGGTLLAYSSASALHVITWLVEERGLPFARAAFTTGVIAAVAGFTGNVVGGWFGDLCERRWAGGRLWSLVILTVVCVPVAATFYLLPPTSPAFHACWVVASAFTTLYFGPLLASVQQLSPVGVRSTLVAFTLLVMNLFGVGPGPWITGMIGDRSSLTEGLLLSLAVALAAVVPFVVAARRYERDARPAATEL